LKICSKFPVRYTVEVIGKKEKKDTRNFEQKP
jgi:hypothetical protein